MHYINNLINFLSFKEKTNYFDSLNMDLFLIISEFLNIQELKNIQISYKSNDLLISSKIQIAKNKKILTRYFNNFILHRSIYKYFKNTFLPMRIISKLPILLYKSYFALGDYIDNIKYKDMNKPVMIGIDFWKRPFICIRYKYLVNGKERKHVLIIFQRFKGVKSNWVKAGHNAGPILHFSQCLLNNEEQKILIKNICQLLSKEKVSTKFRSNGHFGDYVFHDINCFL